MVWQFRHDITASDTGTGFSLRGTNPQAKTIPALTRLVGPGAARRSS